MMWHQGNWSFLVIPQMGPHTMKWSSVSLMLRWCPGTDGKGILCGLGSRCADARGQPKLHKETESIASYQLFYASIQKFE